MAPVLWRFELTCVSMNASKTAPPSSFCHLLLFSHKTTGPVSRWSCWHPPLGSGRSSSFLDQFIPLGVSGRAIQLHIKVGNIPGLVTSSLQYLGVRYLAQGYLGATSTTCCIFCLNWEPSTSIDWAEGEVRRAFDPFHACPAWMPCTHHNVWI